MTDALKMAVENSFGVYISTETQIINIETELCDEEHFSIMNINPD